MLSILPIREIPLVKPGDDLSRLLLDALSANRLALQKGDILVLAQKIVSKAENRLVNLSEVAPLASSDFSFMPGGDYSAKVGSQTVSVKLAADHYYTLVNNSSGQPQLIEEPPFKNKQKSLVRVQNLSDKALTLKTADGKTDVVKAVAAKGRGEREINPVKVSLALYDGDKKVGDVKPVALERGEAAVLYITGSGSSLSPVWVKRPVSTR